VPVPELDSPQDCDTCGAGDAFAAAVTGALLIERTISAAVGAAVGAASKFVADGGAASITSPPPKRPPSPPSTAAEAVARIRRRGGRLVATGGCFDLLHPGHLSLLKQARALGDALVVCVNSDESVRRRKGPGRPIVLAADRIALLEALEPVDAVIMFDEDTPTTLLATVRPDVWVKGGDYTIGDLPEAPVVHRYGGRVVIIPLLAGYSTTQLVSAARTAAAPRRRTKEKV
jgi:rfaE bifunctional protein nucleotidyltransferase chain/domain